MKINKNSVYVLQHPKSEEVRIFQPKDTTSHDSWIIHAKGMSELTRCGNAFFMSVLVYQEGYEIIQEWK